MKDLFEVEITELPPVNPAKNPCLALYGQGPEGKTCKTCIHLFVQGGTSGRYLKCDLRKNTRGPGTDHRAGWMACRKYEEEKKNPDPLPPGSFQ